MSSDETRAHGWAVTAAAVREQVAGMLDSARRAAPLADPTSIKKYLVLSTPRTGSTMFCAGLSNAGMGNPIEWFNELYLLQAQYLLGTPALNIREYVSALVLGTHDYERRVFGVNLHVGHYTALKQRGYDVFDVGFDRVYYLVRRNKARQAYSQAKSTKTGLWSRSAEVLAGYPEPPEINVSASEWCRALTEITTACEFADAVLRHRIDRTFYFEDLVADAGLGNAIRQVAEDMGLGTIDIAAELPMERQSGEFDAANLRHILKELGLPS